MNEHEVSFSGTGFNFSKLPTQNLPPMSSLSLISAGALYERNADLVADNAFRKDAGRCLMHKSVH